MTTKRTPARLLRRPLTKAQQSIVLGYLKGKQISLYNGRASSQEMIDCEPNNPAHYNQLTYYTNAISCVKWLMSEVGRSYPNAGLIGME